MKLHCRTVHFFQGDTFLIHKFDLCSQSAGKPKQSQSTTSTDDSDSDSQQSENSSSDDDSDRDDDNDDTDDSDDDGGSEHRKEEKIKQPTKELDKEKSMSTTGKLQVLIFV